MYYALPTWLFSIEMSFSTNHSALSILSNSIAGSTSSWSTLKKFSSEVQAVTRKRTIPQHRSKYRRLSKSFFDTIIFFWEKMELKYILVILSCTLNLVTSLHLSEPPSWRNLNPSANSTVESAPLTKLDEDSSTPKKILLPIPIGIIPSIPKPQLPNPTQLLGQLQSTLNSLIGTLNSTLGSLKNSTGGGSGGGGGIGIGKPFYRLEEADHLLANISEIIKTSSRADNEILTNFTQTVEQSVDGALRDLEKAVLQLKSASALNATDSSPPTKDVPASVIQENVEVTY